MPTLQKNPNNLTKLLQRCLELLASLRKEKPKTVVTIKKEEIKVTPTTVEVKVEEKIIEVVKEPESKGFLICPIQGKDDNGNPLTPTTVKICSVVDHSGTAIDPSSKNRWGKSAKDQKVIAFNGEVGDGAASSGAPFGYMKKVPAPFFANKEINYVGTTADGSKAAYYLNYDGHAGYDYPYPKLTPVVATAKGRLKKAQAGEDPTYGANWSTDHSFYIIHENGYITWYRHCEKLADNIEVALNSSTAKEVLVNEGDVIAYVGSVGTGGVHLHLELLDDKKKIVDPYKEKLWIV